MSLKDSNYSVYKEYKASENFYYGELIACFKYYNDAQSFLEYKLEDVEIFDRPDHYLIEN